MSFTALYAAIYNTVLPHHSECRFAPYFCEPIVAGLEGKECKPYISGMDLVGAAVATDDFIVSGTCTENCFGMCESLWKKDMVSHLPLPGPLPHSTV